MINPETITNTIGVTGVIIILVTYCLLQTERLSAKSFFYSATNLIGSLFIVVSLIYSWNLPTFVIELAWSTISLYGMYKYFQKPKTTEEQIN